VPDLHVRFQKGKARPESTTSGPCLDVAAGGIGMSVMRPSNAGFQDDLT
jgi:hypothetical protein